MQDNKRKIQIGPYEILRSLAKGGMAEVFLARSTSSHGLGKIVALKRTLPDYLDSAEMGQMFIDEMKVAACLNHQNIVQTFDFGMVKSQAYFVMELIHGVSLRELIAYLRDKGEWLDLPIILYIIREVAEGLDYAAHVQDPSTGLPLNLVHRDLSPHNIMLTFDGEVKIIDFGVAKASATQQTVHGIVKGKIAYMSPEQTFGGDIDQRSDLFSLGIIFWELLTNRRFFAGQSVQEVKGQVREYRFESLNLWESQRVEFSKEILKKLLHHNAERRYPRARELVKELSFILNREYPHFSFEELANHLKNHSFRQRYLDTVEEFKLLSQSQPQERIKLVKKTADDMKTKSLLISSKNLIEMDRVQVVSDNAQESNFGGIFLVLVFVFVGCLLVFAYSLYFPHYKLRVEASRQQTKIVELPQEVSIVFSSIPTGATITVDGKSYLLEGPLSLVMKLNQGHHIDIFKEGFIPRSFKFVPTKSVRYDIYLEHFPVLKLSDDKETKSIKKTRRK